LKEKLKNNKDLKNHEEKIKNQDLEI